MTPYEKIRGQEYRKEILPLGERVLARRPRANVNQLMQPWVTRLWLGRDTLSDEHLIGTAAGVMRSRTGRSPSRTSKMGADSVECHALHTVSPHLNLPGRPRLQRPAYEEPIEAGTLPRFIEIPAAPTKNPKSETATSTPDDNGQSKKRRRQEVTFQEPLQTSSSAGAAARRYSHRLVIGNSWCTDSARHILQRRGPSGLKHIEILGNTTIATSKTSIRVDTKNNTVNLFTKHLDGLRTRALAKKLGLCFLDMAGGTKVGMADGGPNREDQ